MIHLTISSGYAGLAVAKGRVYVTDRVATSGNPATEQVDHYARRRGPGTERVLCLRESTGEILWQYEYNCPYTAAYPAGPRATPTVHQTNAFTVKNGDCFFLSNDEGDLILAKLSTTGYEEIDRCHLLEPTGQAEGRSLVWSHPAFANHSVYARNDREIICGSLAE